MVTAPLCPSYIDLREPHMQACRCDACTAGVVRPVTMLFDHRRYVSGDTVP